MLNVFSGPLVQMQRSWVVIEKEDPLPIVLHFIAFLYCILMSTGFTVKKIILC